MVVIHLKGDGENLAKEQILFETSGETNCGDLAIELTKMQNMRVRLRFMVQAAKALKKELGGNELSEKFTEPVAKAEGLLDPEQATVHRKKILMTQYEEAADTLRGCALIAFPGECSTGIESLCKLLDDDNEDLEHIRCLLTLLDKDARTDDMLVEGNTQLWWASKQLHHTDVLSKYSGKNEKTKLVCKLTKLGGSVPTKEPAIDSRTQQDMMAYYYKKQEESKKLISDEDINYGNSEWANPKGLKNHFQGTGSINWRPR